MLGEILLSGVEALRIGIENGFKLDHLTVAFCGITLTFGLWWYYFYEPERMEQFSFKRAFEWGYGHMLIFASAAAVSSGLGIIIDDIESASQTTQHAMLTYAAVQSDAGHAGGDFDIALAGDLTVSISIAIFIATLWLVRDRHQCSTGTSNFLLVFAVVIGLSGFTPYALPLMTVLLLACVVFRIAQIDRGKRTDIQAT